LNEVETYRDILSEQIATLQQYFDACAVNGGAQNLETEHGLRAIDFKGEAITFRETTTAVLGTLNHCVEIIVNKEDGLKRKYDKEVEKRKKLEEDLK
jgi:collagen type IV alpha-3-binding protein